MNTSNALTVLYDVLKADDLNAKEKITLVESFDKVLSLSLIRESNEIIKDLADNKKIIFAKNDVTDDQICDIITLANERIEAKKAKDFAKADELRDTIQNKYNVTVKDTREGITIL